MPANRRTEQLEFFAKLFLLLSLVAPSQHPLSHASMHACSRLIQRHDFEPEYTTCAVPTRARLDSLLSSIHVRHDHDAAR
ncbi:hypothetical protein IWX91DRAFT_350646 [Phyllosticta citricarpa]